MASLEGLERRVPEHPFTHLLRFELGVQTQILALGWLVPGGLPSAA